MNKSAYLYVIAESETGPTKLGWSVSPPKRLKQLQTGSSGRLRLFHSEEVTETDARTLERRLHKMNAHHRVGGEWYDLDVATAILEVKHVVMRYGLQPELDQLLDKLPMTVIVAVMGYVVRYTHQISGRVRECPGTLASARYMFGYAVSCASDPVLIELVGPMGVVKSHLVEMDIDQ